MDSLGRLLSGIALYLNFSVIFSITLLCAILYLRTKDKTISFFLAMLVSQMLIFAIGLLYHHIIQVDLLHLFEGYGENFAFLSVILVCVMMAAVIYLTVRYTLYLIPLEEKQRRLGIFLSTIVVGIYLLFSLFTVVILIRDEWAVRAEENLNFLFLLGSVILIAPAVLAIIFQGKADRNRKGLLRGIIFSFLPIAATFPIDLLLMEDSPFKLTHLAYALFAIQLFIYIMREHMKEYGWEEKLPQDRVAAFNQAYGISEREGEIVQRLTAGESNKEISSGLFISVNTVKSHIKSIYRKLSVSNRVQLIHKIQAEQGEK